jgi:hypothetical protein
VRAATEIRFKEHLELCGKGEQTWTGKRECGAMLLKKYGAEKGRAACAASLMPQCRREVGVGARK